MNNNFGRQVICMVKADGSKDAFIVVANDGLTVEDIVQRLIDGEKDMLPYKSGFLVNGEWREKILHEYWDTMDNE